MISMKRLGVIGGTGLADIALNDATKSDSIVAETPWGNVPLQCVTLADSEIIFVQRHHGEGCTPPHKIEHRANIKALADAGVEAILAICSVGAIAAEFTPGTLNYAEQYLDLTGVSATFHDKDALFTSMTVPFSLELNKILARELNSDKGLTYFLTQGPQFETAAEISAIEVLGGDVVGMTMPREAKLAAELELPYAAVLISSNWAAGRTPGDPNAILDHQAVSATAGERLGKVMDCIRAILSQG